MIARIEATGRGRGCRRPGRRRARFGREHRAAGREEGTRDLGSRLPYIGRPVVDPYSTTGFSLDGPYIYIWIWLRGADRTTSYIHKT
jgi:hypothetical protein